MHCFVVIKLIEKLIITDTEQLLIQMGGGGGYLLNENTLTNIKYTFHFRINEVSRCKKCDQKSDEPFAILNKYDLRCFPTVVVNLTYCLRT